LPLLFLKKRFYQQFVNPRKDFFFILKKLPAIGGIGGIG